MGDPEIHEYDDDFKQTVDTLMRYVSASGLFLVRDKAGAIFITQTIQNCLRTQGVVVRQTVSLAFIKKCHK